MIKSNIISVSKLTDGKNVIDLGKGSEMNVKQNVIYCDKISNGEKTYTISDLMTGINEDGNGTNSFLFDMIGVDVDTPFHTLDGMTRLDLEIKLKKEYTNSIVITDPNLFTILVYLCPAYEGTHLLDLHLVSGKTIEINEIDNSLGYIIMGYIQGTFDYTEGIRSANRIRFENSITKYWIEYMSGWGIYTDQTRDSVVASVSTQLIKDIDFAPTDKRIYGSVNFHATNGGYSNGSEMYTDYSFQLKKFMSPDDIPFEIGDECSGVYFAWNSDALQYVLTRFTYNSMEESDIEYLKDAVSHSITLGPDGFFLIGYHRLIEQTDDGGDLILADLEIRDSNQKLICYIPGELSSQGELFYTDSQYI